MVPRPIVPSSSPPPPSLGPTIAFTGTTSIATIRLLLYSHRYGHYLPAQYLKRGPFTLGPAFKPLSPSLLVYG